MGVVIPFPGRMVIESAVSKKRMAMELGVSTKFLERRHGAEGFPVSYDAAGQARYVPSEVKAWLRKENGRDPQLGGSAA